MAKSNNMYDLEGLLDELEKTSGDNKANDGYSNDSWKASIDSGEERVEYTIRFLPNPDSKSKSPWVERASHMFEFASGKFIYQPCPKKHNNEEKCYICEQVNELYQSGDPAKEKIGGKRFAKKRFFHNVLIVKDPRDNGNNEGKVKIFECGQQIHDKCVEFLKNTELKPSERIYFHPTMGTNFKIVITWKHDFQNYEKSDFVRRPSAIEINGEELDLETAQKFIDDNAFGLNENLFSEKSFKSYDQLKDLYINQGNSTSSKKTSSKKTPAKTSEEKEIEADINDETIDNKKVEARNPNNKVEVEKEVEEEMSFDVTEDSDEDAELAELLG